MHDTNANGRIDRDCFEESPSCGYQGVKHVMHTNDARPTGDDDRLEHVLEKIAPESIDEEDESMRRESTDDLEVSAWS